jgi:hypothetical protein
MGGNRWAGMQGRQARLARTKQPLLNSSWAGLYPAHHVRRVRRRQVLPRHLQLLQRHVGQLRVVRVGGQGWGTRSSSGSRAPSCGTCASSDFGQHAGEGSQGPRSTSRQRPGLTMGASTSIFMVSGYS